MVRCMKSFYHKTIQNLLGTGRIDSSMRVLVVCGTQLDYDVFSQLGFTDIVVSNINVDTSEDRKDRWDRQNVEALTYEDNAFDFVVVHHGLHHCRQPHQALCEMYRVAKSGVLLFEPCENVLVKIGRWLKVGQEYEVHAVADNQLSAGGVNDETIPNLVHRWTAREVLQTLSAFSPEYRLSSHVSYHMEIHWQDLKKKRSKCPYLTALIAWPFLRLLMVFFPSWANTMAVYIEKPGTLHPWLRRLDDGTIAPNREWFKQHIPPSHAI